MSDPIVRVYLDARDVAELTGLSIQTIRRATAKGELVAMRVGARRLYRPEDVRRWIEGGGGGE